MGSPFSRVSENEMPDVQPSPPPIARQLGTVNAIDRSRQYTRADSYELLRSLNEAWAKIRRLESENNRKDVQIGLLHGSVRRYRGSTILLTSIVSGLAWEGLKYLLPMALRWLGVN